MKPVGAVEESTRRVSAQRALVEQLASEPEATCMVVNAHGTPVAGPDWLPLQRREDGTSRLVTPEFRSGIISAFAASFRNPHVVSATKITHDPDRLRQLHLISLPADDPDGTGQDLTVIITFPDDDAKLLVDERQPDLVPRRWISYTCDEVGTLLTHDQALEDILGWTADDLLGKPILGIIHPDHTEEAIHHWLAVATSEEPVRGRAQMRTKDGEWRWFEVTNTNLLSTAGYVQCDLLDITSEVQVVDELSEREEVLRRLTEALPSGVVQFDRDGRLIFANDRLAEITGVLHGELKDYLELFDPATQEDIQELALSIYADAIEVDMEVELHRQDAEVRFARLAFRPLLVDEGGAGGMLICVDDITESWTLRKELARQASTDGLTGVANRSASHDALIAAVSDRRSNGTGVVFFDLNGFKTANDNHGHAHGDNLLVTFARRLSAQARDTDTVGRVGGDEFIMIVPDVGLTQLAAMAKRVLDYANATGDGMQINASCGYTLVDPIDSDESDESGELDDSYKAAVAERAISEADAAMYVHKRSPGPWPVQFDQTFLASDDSDCTSDEREAS